MTVEIKVPSVGESVTEAILAEWFKQDGDTVQKDEPLFVIETDKVTLEVVAEADGILSIKAEAGQTVAIGEVVGTIDTDEAPQKEKEEKPKPEAAEKKGTEEKKAAEEKPAEKEISAEQAPQEEEKKEPREAEKKEVTSPQEPQDKIPPKDKDLPERPSQMLGPSVRNLISQKNIDIAKIEGSGPDGRITRGDALLYIESSAEKTYEQQPVEDRKTDASEQRREKGTKELSDDDKQISRKPMSQIRRRIASRLLEAKQNTAMLTTFNEIDMSRVLDIRTRFKESFKEKHGVSLGLMSFFIKATTEALIEYPEVNAFIEDDEIIYHHYYHIGIAVGAEKGLVVPVIRYADRLSFAELEQSIVDYVNKIKDNRLELSDLEGGTFTITNGGVYGSLLSTPILNMPQSGILGMHKIEKRPVAVDGQIEVRPMMYVALSYDHRMIDGREAVSFLKRIKEVVENPEQMMMEM
ncbi:MAG: 2-oxoglutarate dehydrogenase complex dihydrolipoyllysine-residue succinyltransferase [Desulfobacterales bacterium]|jgi:2-oxoglutarate dehydrogenase E2 component (dihydrolipoamide succinyltransferase)